jgi:hypothetical protein
MAQSPNLPSQNERAARLAERFGMTRADIEHLLTETNAEYSKDAPSPAPLPLEVPIVTSGSRPKPLSGGALAIIFAILLIGLAIALSLKQGYFQQRSDRLTAAENRSHPKPVDTMKNVQNQEVEQSAAPIPPTTVPAGELPPESQVGIPRSVVHHAKPVAPRPLLQTTSNFEAEEKLADLRADGNTNARIRSVRKHGAVSYQVLSK